MATSRKSFATRSPDNTCVYFCWDETSMWTLLEDNSQPGYYCPNEWGPCDSGVDTHLETVEALPEEGLRLASSPVKMPKDSALYLVDASRKVLRRVKGKWSKGMSAAAEITFKELAKIDKKLADFAVSAAKNKAVAGIQLIVPAQKSKTAGKKASPKKKVAANKKTGRTPSKSIAKSSTKRGGKSS